MKRIVLLALIVILGVGNINSTYAIFGFGNNKIVETENQYDSQINNKDKKKEKKELDKIKKEEEKKNKKLKKEEEKREKKEKKAIEKEKKKLENYKKKTNTDKEESILNSDESTNKEKLQALKDANKKYKNACKNPVSKVFGIARDTLKATGIAIQGLGKTIEATGNGMGALKELSE